LEQGAYVEVAFVGQRLLSTRWVLTVKAASLPGLLPRLKARLCVRGFQDQEKDLVDSASPTVARSTVRLVLALFASMGWEPRSVDASTAFLQGLPIDCPRPVYVRPPLEARAPAGVVWRLAKCAYGLTDAPRMCYERVRALMRAIGAERSTADLGLFVLAVGGVVILAVAVHVDDFLYGGTAAGVSLLERELRAAFSVGPVSTGTFVFTGLSLSYSAGAGRRAPRLWVDQTPDIDSIDDISVSAARRAEPSAAVKASELTDYRRATGCAAVGRRPDASGLGVRLRRAGTPLPACPGLGSCARKPDHRCRPPLAGPRLTVPPRAGPSLLVPVNRLLGGVPPLVGRPVRVGHLSGLCRRLEAAVIFLGRPQKGCRRPHCVGQPPAASGDPQLFRRRRLEPPPGAHAALGVADVACLLLSGPGGADLPVHAFIGSRSLYDALTSSATTGSKEVRAAVADLREHCRLGSLSSVSWLPGSHQLTDGLTKRSGGRALRDAVASGWFPVPRALVTKSAPSGGAPAWATTATVVAAPAPDSWRL